MAISEVTRLAIIDELMLTGVDWAGRFDEPDFLARIYAMHELPSTDPRFPDAYRDVAQHRLLNDDWSADWVFRDPRFELQDRDSDEVFLRFLAETVHPAVRLDQDQATRLVQLYNRHLRMDGYELAVVDRISGRPVYGAREVAPTEVSTPEPSVGGTAAPDRVMSPSERVTAIVEIARRLDEQDWTVANLTLTEFGAETEPEWSGSLYDYVLEMLGRTGDRPIQALAVHLGLRADGTSGEPESDVWEDGRFRLFISHLAAHKAYAHELKVALDEFGISAFVAHDDIEPSAEWLEEIEKALFSTDALVALVHEGFVESQWTDQEVGAVMGQRKMILAVRLGATPHGFLGQYQAIPGGAATATAGRIFEVLVGHRDTRRSIAYAVVHKVEHPSGHNDNQANFRLLGRIQYLDRALADRLEAALDDVHYVSVAYNKVKVMTELFERFGLYLNYEEEPSDE